MSDRLVSLGQSPALRRIAGTVGVSLPPDLDRATGPWEARPLEGRAVTVLLAPYAQLAGPLAHALAEAGAEPGVVGDAAPFTAAGEAWARPAKALPVDGGPDERPHVVVLDATGLATIDDLKALRALMAPRMRSLRSSGRVVVLARPPESAPTVEARAVQRALEGFTRSVAKEVGRKGSTANQLVVPSGCDDRIAAPLRFLASLRSVYVSGQVLTVSEAVPAPPAKWTRPLDGKVALVTGSARGIGAATARALAREGAKVVVLDRPGDEAEAKVVAGEIGGVAFCADLGDGAAPAAIATFLKDTFGGVDVVVHNAGVTRDRTLGKLSDADWDLPIDINLGAVLALHSALTPLLREGARVVCLSSIAGLAGNVGQTAYAASKAGVVGFVQGEAPALAARGIALNAVAPGFIETRMTAAIPLATREVARRLSNLSQGGLPEDVAEALTFFATPSAAACSGQVLRVCGGSLVGA